MSVFDVVVLTDPRYLEDSSDPYKHNVFYEDQLVVEALRTEGLKVERKSWDAKYLDWSKAKALIFRSTWDYFDRFKEFSKWIDKVSKQTQLINSERLFRWNIDKHYLLDLQRKEVNIPESYFIEKGCQDSLNAIHKKLQWHETVLKPCVSGAGRHTYKLNAETIPEYETLFSELIHHEAFVLQPFQHRIVSDGEISLMLFNGQFTHAILKKAKPGDFRVQDDFGGTVHSYKPTEEEITLAINALSACPELPIYARVDIIRDNVGDLAVSELELIEPELWFREHPAAAQVLAKAIKNHIHS